MYLAKQKRGDRIYLAILHGYKDKYGKNKNKTIKTIGFADKYSDIYEDPIAHFEEKVKKMNEELKKENSPVVMKFFPNQKIDKRKCQQIDLGAAVMDKYFYSDLDIWSFFEKKRTARKIQADPCRILEMLIFNRITNPTSKKKAWETRERFPRKCAFSLDDVYKSITYLSQNCDALIEHMNNSITNTRGKRKDKHIYYDVTNYYFEIENEDDLRRRGVSKEHRPNPIVQMGLLLDSQGLPCNFDIFRGNCNDNETLMPIMKKSGLRKKNNKVIMVADKGLNCSNNIAACILDGNGYIFSQSVRRANKDFKSWVVDEKGYIDNKSGTFKIKSRQSYKNVYITTPEGKKKCVKVPVKEVAFWSKDYADRSKYERSKVIKKSMLALKNNYMQANKAHSSLKYTKDIPINKNTGEIASHNWVLDEKRIINDELYDGYYAIVTSEVDMDDKEIIDAYRGLWKIEESFKIMKGDFKARPLYVSLEDHIKAHFLICYIALFIMRLIQVDTKNRYSATQISNALKNMVGHRMQSNYFMFDYRDDITDEFEDICKEKLNLNIQSKGQIDKIMSHMKNFKINK